MAFVLIAAIVMGLWVLGESPADLPGDAVNFVTDVTTRGQRLTISTPDANGVIREAPSDLVDLASSNLGRPIDPEAYALARMCRSEEGAADTLTKVRLCNVAQNQAQALGWSVWELMLFHTTASRAGRFGKQISGRFSTSQDPYENDLAAAEQAQALGDQTDGALNFADKRAFGIQIGSATFEDFKVTLGGEGKNAGTLPDSPSHLVFWWRGSIPENAVPA